MESRVYKIEPKDLMKIKNVLEREDMFDVKAICEKCGNVLEGKFPASIISNYECDCGGDYIFERKILIANEFARNGYNLRAGETLGYPGKTYVYIKAEKEFFNKNEKILTAEGATRVSDKEAIDIENKIKEESEKAAEGFGGIFG